MAALLYFFYLLMKPATIVMALLGFAGIFAPETDPNIWWLPAFSGLFLPIIMILNFLILIFWIYFRRLWIFWPLLALIGNYSFFNSMYQSPWKEMPDVGHNKEIIIASFNVQGFYNIAKNPEKCNIKKMVEDKQIDIFCIQEHCEEAHLPTDFALQKFNMPYRAVHFMKQTDWVNLGLSVYSRYPIINQGAIDFNSHQNGAMWVDIKVDNDTIRIFNNHLQTTDVSTNEKKYYQQKSIRDWKGQARTLVRIMDNLKDNFCTRAQQSILISNSIDTCRYPVIVTGDFNDTPVSFAYHQVRGDKFQDGFIDCGRGYGHSFNGLRKILRIDFIAYDNHFKGIEYNSPTLDWSDHNPIVMKLALTKSNQM